VVASVNYCDGFRFLQERAEASPEERRLYRLREIRLLAEAMARIAPDGEVVRRGSAVADACAALAADPWDAACERRLMSAITLLQETVEEPADGFSAGPLLPAGHG
jgi:hypothetical protein